MTIYRKELSLRERWRNCSTALSMLMVFSLEEMSKNWRELRAFTRLMLSRAGDARGLAQFDKDIVHYDARLTEMIALGQISEGDGSLRRGFHAYCMAADAARSAAGQAAVWQMLDINPRPVFKDDPSAYRGKINQYKERFEAQHMQYLRARFDVNEP